MEKIVKRFPGVLANDHVTIEVEQGEIHALLGENGAGKTTLMNILYGFYRQDGGQISLRGEPVEIDSPSHAIEHGIGMVHQHFMLVPIFSVTENIILGQEREREPLLDLGEAEARMEELSRSYGLAVEPKAKVWQLSVGAQQRVEIIKALYRGADILILDEPTAVLTPSETEELFTVLRRLAEEGHTVIFITHKLQEVMEISDRVTVLRDGRVVGTVRTEDMDRPSLAKMMVGREIFLEFERQPVAPGERMLEVEDLWVRDDRGQFAVRGVSLSLRAGEILGVAGVDGNGQLELADTILNLRAAERGEIRVAGRIVTGCTPREIMDMGVALIPSDRRTFGLITEFTLSENLILKSWGKAPFAKYQLFDFDAIRDYSKRLVQQYDIRAPGIGVKVADLSGGNQQKVVLARELARQPDLLIASQPTRGLDVGATEYVRNQLLEERARGAAVLMISTELEEIMSLSDRIVVMYEGEIMGEVTAEVADLEEIGLMMAGAKREPPQLPESKGQSPERPMNPAGGE
jgi:simple sugar transport system ATP-binding protein